LPRSCRYAECEFPRSGRMYEVNGGCSREGSCSRMSKGLLREERQGDGKKN
jgi:hypothetical protein